MKIRKALKLVKKDPGSILVSPTGERLVLGGIDYNRILRVHKAVIRADGQYYSPTVWELLSDKWDVVYY